VYDRQNLFLDVCAERIVNMAPHHDNVIFHPQLILNIGESAAPFRQLADAQHHGTGSHFRVAMAASPEVRLVIHGQPAVVMYQASLSGT